MPSGMLGNIVLDPIIANNSAIMAFKTHPRPVCGQQESRPFLLCLRVQDWPRLSVRRAALPPAGFLRNNRVGAGGV